MSNSISLTASMRSNLLSLQNIAGQVDLTQNRLSTGLKVNSAIDNPSSYYTAVSLNNRAGDLSALLDSMAQGIQTIKAATEGLEAGANLLEQAAATATQALETVTVPAKSWFEEQEGVAAVVSSKEELLAAIDSGKSGDIVIYGQIDMGNTGITLKEGQNLKGIGAYGIEDREINKFSALNFEFDDTSPQTAVMANKAHIISDFTVTMKSERSASIRLFSTQAQNTDTIEFSNMDVSFDVLGEVVAFYSNNSSNFSYNGNFTVQDTDTQYAQTGKATHQAFVNGNMQDADVKVKLAQGMVFSGGKSIVTNSRISLQTIGETSVSLSSTGMTLNGKSEVNIKGENAAVGHVVLNDQSRLRLENVKPGGHILANESIVLNDRAEVSIYNSPAAQGGWHSITGTTITINSTAAKFNITGNYFTISSKINMVEGASMVLSDGRYTADGTITDLATTTGWQSNFSVDASVKPSFDHASFDRVFADFMKEDETLSNKNAVTQYNEIIKQYDALVKDSSYKGINLLKEQDLTVTFNEDRSAQLAVKGKDASSQALGLLTTDWQNQEDVAQSLAEIAEALTQIRQMSSELGNYYSIVTTRENFTQNLINVLTEGADKLTLADMNEESANMLALQTRQQLAVNSLSLASQASQSILKLF